MRRLTFPAIAGFLGLGFLIIAPGVSAQAGSFAILLKGARVGTATCNFATTTKGYDSTSVVNISLQGLEYSLSKTEALSSSNELQHVFLSAVVNGEAVTINAVPDAGQVILDISANGRKTTTRLSAHAGAVVMPDFDPGALETLLALAVERNNHDLWAIIPKNAGTIAPVQLATYADEQGTLDGRIIAVHHIVVTITGAKADLFSGPDNRLLQAELPQQGFAIVRNGFVLKPPGRAPAPPAQ
ncbi:MAG TPA: hypothetical protein VGR47_07130 [Terracidiphilus sp.]|nr:hypothetical protein [Terracidiphilus sp.]